MSCFVCQCAENPACAALLLYAAASVWLHNRTVSLSQSSQATAGFPYEAYRKSADQSLPFSNHWEQRWRHLITTFTCTQETRLVEKIKLRQEVGGLVYMHCDNLITLNLVFPYSWSVIRFLPFNLLWTSTSTSTVTCFYPGWIWLVYRDTGMHCYQWQPLLSFHLTTVTTTPRGVFVKHSPVCKNQVWPRLRVYKAKKAGKKTVSQVFSSAPIK